MMSKFGILVLALLLVAPIAWAADESSSSQAPPANNDEAHEGSIADGSAPPAAEGVTVPRAMAIMGGCIGAAICTIGGGFSIARIGGKCIEAIARQPEAAGTMFAPMIVSAAMVEGGMLFGIVVCLLGVLAS